MLNLNPLNVLIRSVTAIGGVHGPTALKGAIGVYYTFEESSGTRADSEGAIDLTTINGTCAMTTSGKVANAVIVDGSNDWMTGTGANAVFDDNTKFSVNFWYKTPTSSPVSENMVFHIPAASGPLYMRVLNAMAEVSLNFANGAKKVVVVTETAADDTWFMVSVTWDGTQADADMGKCYINSSLKTTNYSGTPFATTLGTLTTDVLSIGAFASGGSKTKATLDEFAFFPNYILSQTEVNTLYNSGSGLSYADI